MKKLFNLFGLHICKLNVTSSAIYQIVKALETHNINVVFDIGANTGQFASGLRDYGYTGKIISFEPLSQAHKLLVKNASKDINWFVHQQVAVGAEVADCISINVAGNSVSSSILPMLETHINAAPESQYIHTEQVPIITLDSILDIYTNLSDNFFIKIDTQGYEWAVLDGAPQALKQSKGILMELSLVPLYEGQRLWLDCIERLKNINLQVYSLQSGFTELRTGKTLQVDGLFFK
jgi:FkbM family methyltransferase